MNYLHLPSINEIDEMTGGCYTQTWSGMWRFRYVLESDTFWDCG